MAGISVWILMYVVAANLSVWFFSSALLLYRQFILQSSNTLRLVTAQEIKQFRIKLEPALQKGTDNRSIFSETTPHHTKKMHKFGSRHKHSLRGLPSLNSFAFKSAGKHDGHIQIHNPRFYWKSKLQRISWFILLPQMHTTQIAINARN